MNVKLAINGQDTFQYAKLKAVHINGNTVRIDFHNGSTLTFPPNTILRVEDDRDMYIEGYVAGQDDAKQGICRYSEPLPEGATGGIV